MNAKSWIVVVALAVSASAVIVAWRAAAAARVVECECETLLAERATVAAKLRRLDAASAQTERARADATAALAVLRAQQTAAVGPRATASSIAPQPALPSTRAPHPGDILANDPRMQALSVAAQRARFETAYGPLLHRLRLSPAQVAKLGEAHAIFDELQQDMAMVMRDQKLPPDDPALAKLRQQATDELRGAQLEVLGPAGYEQLQHYERTMPAREIVKRFAGAMAVADRPITAEQADRLTLIMAEASASAPGRNRVNPTSIDWAVVDRRAAEVLSPAQLSLFKRIEPIGGGASRWMAQFQRAMEHARKTMTAGNQVGPAPPK